MRAILIDPFAKTVTEAEYEGDYHQVYSLIHADTFTVVQLDDEGDALFLDDEGLLKEGQEFFAIGNYPSPLAGRGLILGTDDEGESVATRISLDVVRAAVHWLSAEGAVTMNAAAVQAMEDGAARQREGGDFVIVAAPQLVIGEDGKARAE
jgi:hypothetical protein